MLLESRLRYTLRKLAKLRRTSIKQLLKDAFGDVEIVYVGEENDQDGQRNLQSKAAGIFQEISKQEQW